MTGRISSIWPDWPNPILAKSSPDIKEPGETLAEHTWEVLSRLRDLTQVRPRLPELCRFPLWQVLFWATFFHDWGKAAAGFQAMLKGAGRWQHRHEVLSLLFLDWVATDLPEEQLTAITAAIASHHRDASELNQLYPFGLSEEDDPIADLVGELDDDSMRMLYRWWVEKAPIWIKSLGFDKLGVIMIQPIEEEQAIIQARETGIKSIRKFLSKYQQLVGKLRDGDGSLWVSKGLFLRGCLITADYIASAHTGPLPVLRSCPKSVLDTVELSENDLYDHQRKATAASGSVVLISPTGSGKTEAALLWASRQAVKKHGYMRLFYVLPYQASMNAMFDRLNRIFPQQVGLLHSRSVLALYHRYIEQENFSPEEAARVARRARDLASIHYHPVRVFSPYQMLKAAYQMKGYEAMLTDYAGGTFIFDEIHAYEPGRLAMILELSNYLKKELDASFFIMSATMPSVILKQVKEAIGCPSEIRASDSLFRSFTRHKVYLEKGDLISEQGIELIREAFEQRRSVLVTCNTVARAQEAYRLLQAHIPFNSLVMVHGRFNGRDRLEKENYILLATGLKSDERKPIVVVSTQVVEVSLNIDLDILFSDPAPLEALVQRFGRINRNRRVEIAPVHIFSEPIEDQKVYLPSLINKALYVLGKYMNGRCVNEAFIQVLLDEIYSGSILDEWEALYTETASEFNEAFLKTLTPFTSDEALAQAFDHLFDSMEVLPISLKEEYKALFKERPIEAAQLLVPISWGRWMQLQRAGLVRSEPNQWPSIVDIPYDKKLGLICDSAAI